MSTPAHVGIVNSDGTVTRIYVHSDGYPEHLGCRLLESYNSEEKARELIAGGDIRTIGNCGQSPQYYEKRGEPVTLSLAEGRQRSIVYSYLWEGEWRFLDQEGNSKLTEVIDALWNSEDGEL